MNRPPFRTTRKVVPTSPPKEQRDRDQLSAYATIAKAMRAAYTTAANAVLGVRRMNEDMIVGFLEG